MTLRARRRITLGLAAILLAWPVAWPGLALSWDLDGTKRIAVRTRDGETIPIGTVTFRPQGDRIGFALDLDHSQFKDFFLSMREFKCLEGAEIHCHVPYPYPNPRSVTPGDLSWLEHSLMFLFNLRTDFGAKLTNGLYYAMRVTDEGIVGTPQAIDLNAIAAPPKDASVVPFTPEERSEVTPGSRWIEALTIR